MDKSKVKESVKYIMPAILAVVIIVGLTKLGQTGNMAASSESSGSMIGYHSAVCKEVTRADGSRENLGCTRNYFSNEGKNITRDLLGWAPFLQNLGNVSVIGLGNGTWPLAGNNPEPNINYTNGAPGGAIAPIPDCGLAPALGTMSIPTVVAGGGNWSVAKTFTSTCSNEGVNQTALYNNTAGGNANYFAANNFTSVTLQNGDAITVTWYIWVTG